MPRKKIDKDKAVKIQKKLQAATLGPTVSTGTKLEELLKLHDRSGDGLLDAAELTKLIRKDFNVQKHEISDEDIQALVDALDDDGNATLSIHELADFIKRGTATFFESSGRGLTATEMRLKRLEARCVRHAPRQPSWRDFEPEDEESRFVPPAPPKSDFPFGGGGGEPEIPEDITPSEPAARGVAKSASLPALGSGARGAGLAAAAVVDDEEALANNNHGGAADDLMLMARTADVEFDDDLDLDMMSVGSSAGSTANDSLATTTTVKLLQSGKSGFRTFTNASTSRVTVGRDPWMYS